MFYEQDIELFFNEFALDVVYNGNTTLRAIIDTDYVLASQEDGFSGIEAYDVQAVVMTKDVPGIKHDDTIQVGDTVYYVKAIRHSGTGTTMLFLSEVQ